MWEKKINKAESGKNSNRFYMALGLYVGAVY